ncbi:MAG: oligoendopeptidase F [Clostridiales bacterium]|jgi:oligoendopeptidase F|nr:oligoendopeptidase F [Eubacteriales bacterium]MDH7567725.1 oligoendopeptidase F [Clostridiales bacterium]
MAGPKNKTLPKREEISGGYKWKLEDIYSSNDRWEEDFSQVKALSGKIIRFKDHLAESAGTLLECLKEKDELLALNDKVFVYARMRRDENNGDPVYQALTDRAMALSTEAYAAVSFIVPEILRIPEDTLRDYMEGSDALKPYKQFMDEILRQKQHILSEREEELLALAAEVAQAPHDIFTIFNNADIKFPFIKDESGEEIEVTKGRYIKLLESKDRRVRQDAFHALYSSYHAHRNTLASMLINNIKKNRFFASVRKYGSSLEASLDSDNISTGVYDNLIDTVNKNLHLLHRYLELRKRALKVDRLHMYDLYVPLVEEPKTDIPYREALAMVEDGLKPLGDEYLGYLRQGFNSGWIDVYENEGKTSGAYSWGTYKTHPYVLLNYQGTINDVFTIAHEMGHALHSFYTNKTQPYIYSEYKIFVAEVASTVNESLLMRHLLNSTSDKGEKAYLLNHYLEEFRSTVFRQVMFAEFEKITHSWMEQGQALTAQSLNGIYRELNQKYFGNRVVVDEDIDIEWARIPHFYTSFYVYKYATGFSAATSLSRQILDEGGTAVNRYLEFLRSGSSDYPLELLKRAGVDLYTPKPVQDAFNVFEEILNELEGLI